MLPAGLHPPSRRAERILIKASRSIYRRKGFGPAVEAQGVDERSGRIERRLEPFVVVAALLVIPLIAIEESSLGEPWDSIAVGLNWGTWLVFLLEAVVMLSVVPDRWRWIREHPIDVAVVLLTPPFASALAPVRLLRLLRLLRILRLASIARRLFSAEGLQYTAALAALTAVAGGSAFAALEGDPSSLDGIYWAITTMTTVGYGDELPTLASTKVLAIVIMLVGIGFVAVLTGAIAERFLSPDLKVEAEEVEQELDAASDAIVRELRELRGRLDGLEAAVRQRS